MAIERPPKYAALSLETVKSYRPPEDKVYIWHTVTSGMQENFGTIAARHRVPVDKIIGFNFPGTVENGRVLTDVVNWYLRHHRGFGGPETRDRRNRMFKGGEKVAIPYMSTIQTDGPIFLEKTKPVNLDEPGHILASQKFVWERKIPKDKPAESGNVAWQVRISGEGEISQTGLVKTQFKKDQLKAQIETSLEKDLNIVFSAKFDEKVLEAIAKGVKANSKEDVMKAIASPLEASLKQYYKFGNFTVVPEAGFEVAEFLKKPDQLPTPFVFRVAGEYQDAFPVEGVQLKWKLVFKAGFNVGLSKKGWAWIVKKVGGEVLKRFLAQAGAQLARVGAYLVAEGILAAGAVVVGAVAAGVAVTALTAWLVEDARRKGELKGLASWYYTAYLAKVFGRPRPTGFVVGDAKMRDELVLLGEKDSVNTAVDIVRRRNETASYPTPQAALERYREIAVHLFGSEANAERELQKTLQAHIEKQVGL
jgi:hypothetical protein